jgi:hypothetical protein
VEEAPVPYGVRRLYHSTHLVADLSDAVTFFKTVFGRDAVPLGVYLGSADREPNPRYPYNYATFTEIAEVLFESIDPALHLVDGVQYIDSVSEPHLETLAWFVDGVEDLWAELRRRGIRGVDQKKEEPTGEGPPLAAAWPTPLIFTVPEDTGLSYELCPYFPNRDPRGEPPRSAVSPGDPLGIERCAHHTVLTDRPERPLRLLIDVLGGRVIHEGVNDARATQSVFVALADGIVELGRPVEDGSPAMEDWRRRASDDTYHAITWKVRDLDRAAEHLQTAGVAIVRRTPTTIVTDPGAGLGVPWGFTTADVPGDPRP